MAQGVAPQPILTQERLAAGLANVIPEMLIHVLVQFNEILELLIANCALIRVAVQPIRYEAEAVFLCKSFTMDNLNMID